MAAHVYGHVTYRSSGNNFGGGLQAEAISATRQGDSVFLRIAGKEGSVREWRLYIPVSASLALGRAICTVAEGHVSSIEATL